MLLTGNGAELSGSGYLKRLAKKAGFAIDIMPHIAILCFILIRNDSQRRFENMTVWLRLKEAAEYLKMGKSTVYKLAQEGRLPGHKVLSEWRFDAKELDDWLKAGKLASSENNQASNEQDEG